MDSKQFETKNNRINVKKLKEMPELQHTLEVIGVTTEQFQNEPVKLAICFGGTDQILVLNKTNLSILQKAKGTETDLWRGAKVNLIAIPSKFNGSTTESVIISKVV